GWIALSAVLTFGLLAVGGALWYRTRGNGERTGSEKQRGQMLSHRTPREATSLAGDKGLTVSIWIHSVPQGAEVRSSEKLIGRTPLRMPLPVGEAQAFVFHLEGYREAQRTLIPKRETRIVIVELEKKAVSRQTHQPQKKRKRKRGISLKDLRDPFGRKK
ncbi:MAG: PEGA domain-containing protein, partial [Deltaproteobacteria bacterium]|nr:PEGA domain-containing protein [Deltaproteobacteria bacterium]